MGFSLKSLGNIGKDLVFGRSGPSNPYSAVDFGALMKTDLEKPGQAYDWGGAYKNLLSMINAPSSVEAVQQDIQGQQMQNLMGQVDINTKNAYGSTLSDMADRGLVGPGQSSDIAANALGQVQAQGARTKSDINAQYALADLQRLMGKEQAAQGAQQNYANTLAQFSTNANSNALQRLLGLSGQQADAYSAGASLANQHTPGLLENFGNSFVTSYGNQLGKNSAGPGVDDIMKMFAMGGGA